MRIFIDNTAYYIDSDKLEEAITAIAPPFLTDANSAEAKANMAERVILKGITIPFKRLINKYLVMSWKGDVLSNLTHALIVAVVSHVTKNEWELITIGSLSGDKQIVGLRPRTSPETAPSAQGRESQQDASSTGAYRNDAS